MIYLNLFRMSKMGNGKATAGEENQSAGKNAGTQQAAADESVVGSGKSHL